jgi:D-alanyl-D-alanine carboxypeptidase
VAGLSDITARIAQINQQIHALRPAPVRPSGTPAAAGATTAAAPASGQAFAAQLESAVRAAGAGPQAPVKLTKDGIPADLVSYGNGRIPPTALESIGTGNHRLWAPAAQQFQKMIAAAKADGVRIGVTDSYRSYGEQVDLARRKGLYSQGGLAAKPGTSEHGWGLSLDLDLGTKAQKWMRAHGAEYGWKENVPREPWHWTFKPKS